MKQIKEIKQYPKEASQMGSKKKGKARRIANLTSITSDRKRQKKWWKKLNRLPRNYAFVRKLAHNFPFLDGTKGAKKVLERILEKRKCPLCGKKLKELRTFDSKQKPSLITNHLETCSRGWMPKGVNASEFLED